MRASGFLFLLEQGLCGICLMSALSAALGLPRASRGRRLLFAILYAGFTLLSLSVPPLLQVVMVLPLTGLLALIGRFPARRTLPFCLTMLMMQWGCAGLSALLPLPGAVQTALTCTLLLLLRRLTRDYRTRGNDALSTLARWESVRRGEEKHIFPYQENADVMFNSSLFYEISVLRRFAEPILREVPDTVPEYGEAKRMLKFLDNFIPISPEEIPPTSLLREFIGGSSFKY